MNNTMKILGIALLAVLAVTAVGAGVAFAQTPTPTTGYGPGWMMGGSGQAGYGRGMMGGRGGMMGGYAQAGGGYEWMDAMHAWMTETGGMHTFVWDALADVLGLTNDELTAEVNSGKTIAEIAEAQGVSRADLVAAVETAHQDALAQAVADGALTQEQADAMLTQMAGRYEWMIDNMGAGYGMMGGQYGAGGCHGNWDGSTPGAQSRP